MDRSTTHANEYRASELSRPVYGRATAESFRQQQQSQEHEAIAARSYQDSNAVNHAFLEFHKARMASNDRNAESTAVNAAMTSSLAQQEASDKSNNETAREPRSALISVPDASHLRNEVKQPRSGRGGTFSRRGASVDRDTRHIVELDGRGSSYERGRGGGDLHRGRGGEDGRGRGRLLDLSHARGRGRAGVMLDRSRHEEEAANSRSIRGHEPGHGQRAHHRGGRPGFGGRLAHGYNGRGRGPEPDADFDRGGKPSGHRQLYQAPMGIRSESRPEQSGNKSGSNERRKQEMREDSDVDEHDEEHGEHSGSDGDMLGSSEPAARPGIINTGIDVAALHNSGRKGKGERRERNRRREGRDRSQGQGKSHDAMLMDEREVANGSRDDTARRHHSSPYRGPPPPPFEDGPHPFPHYHLPPPHGPHHDYLPPPPPPPGGFHHHHPPGPPPPPPGFWPPRPFDSPPSRHRGYAEDPSYRKPLRNERNPKRDRIPGAGRGYDSASNRDTGSRDGHDRSSIGLGSPVPGPRQLFDPGRDDPVKFSAQKSAIGSERASSALASDARSVASSATRTSISSLSVASSDYRSRYSGRSDALLDEVESTASGAGSNALLRELKASYREILSVEAKLQDEDSYAKSAIEEQARIYGHDADDRGAHEKRPDEYWAKLVQLHREGAEAFHSFMERCMDPMVPASIHSIPQKYNLPSRMWKSAFLLLFERLRHALPASENGRGGQSFDHADGTDSTGNVTDHLTDFVYYAYTFYTQLLEQQSLSSFRGTWIEQLGDIARYRMTVAEVPGQIPMVGKKATLSDSGHSLKALLEGEDAEETGSPHARGNSLQKTPKKQLVSRKDRKKGFAGMPTKVGQHMEVADTPGNSIGAAALDDWELVEHETWRAVARDWYFLGLSETPGTGRLHHHLALLAEEEDDLRTLYHCCKSVAASHPYSSGAAMIKAFFAPEKQMARLQADVPASSIFVHLHGLLYTQTNLASFDTGLARLEEKLEETFVYAKAQATRQPRRSIRGKERDDPSQRLNRDSTWIMMAVSNIAAMMEYGRENGLLRAALVKAQDQKKSEKQSNRAEKKNNPHGDPTPSEASLHDLAKQVERLGLEISKQKSATRNTSADLPSIPVTLQLAMRLTFSLLRVVFRHPMKPDEIDPAICPYITTMLTFLATLAHNEIAFAIVRSEVPWEALRGFLDTLPKFALDAYLRKDSNVPNRLLGITLPEDWCIRGLEWTGKQLFGRGYWKGKLGTAYMSVSQSEAIGISPSGEAHGYSMPDSEKDVLAERYEGPSMPPHAGGPQRTAIEDAQLDEDGEEPSDRETVARLRWKRVALCAAWLARAVPFIALKDGKITFDKALFDTVTEQDSARYDASHEEAVQGEGASIVDKPSRAQAVAETDELDSDDYLLGSGDESETVKELKARRRELKALLQESRESRNFKKQQALTSSGTGSDYQQQRHAARSTINALAGYTTLVFDTNVLLEAIEMFTALLATKKWTLVVPLAVVTELDGLRTKEDSLGTSATQAINFLEDAVKSYSMNLKVQTSKGNYLRDLNIRREDIDFGHNANYGQRGNNGSDGSVKSMDDVILNVAMWQKTHWLDRRALLGIKANAKAEKENAVSSGSPVKTVLVSSDRTLRLKGKARGLEVCDAVTLQQLVEQPPNG